MSQKYTKLGTNDMKTNILIFDDRQADLFATSKILKQQGYTIHPVSNFSNATVVLRDNNPDIVIVNWDLPDGKSKELVELIKGELAVMGFVYIIATSRQQGAYHAVRALRCGVDHFVFLPIDNAILIAELNVATRIIGLQKTLSCKCEELIRLHGELRMKNEQNQKLAQIDELTGLANRREGMKRLEDSWALCERHGNNMGCLYVDIDHFKSINDTYGHEVGDIALKHVAQLLRDHVRKGEGVFRLGGEEFVIICPVANIGSALGTGERMRQAIQKSHLNIKPKANSPEYHTLKITVSIGVAVKKEEHGPYIFQIRLKLKDPVSPDDLLSMADKQLYLAKQSGRNRVC